MFSTQHNRRKFSPVLTSVMLLLSLAVSLSGVVLQAQDADVFNQTVEDQQIMNEIAANGRALVFVTLKSSTAPGAAKETLRSDVASVQSRVLASVSPADFQVSHQYRISHALGGYVNLNGLSALRQHPDVLSVQLSPKAETYNVQAGQLVDADDVHALGFTGEGVRVAVIDTGIDPDHPDLESSIIGKRCFLANQIGCPNGQNNTANDVIGHGSHVSGTITSDGQMAVIGEKGLAPDAGVYAFKVFDDFGNGTGVDILAAIDYIADRQDTLQIDIVNISLGFPSFNSASHCDTSFDNFFDTLFTAIGAMETITVVAAGNNADATKISVPACYSNVISVGAVYTGNFGGLAWSSCTDLTTAANKIACFSQAAPILDLLGPGALLDSTVPDDTYEAKGGTSMASPAVAAVIALLLEKNPSLTQAQVLLLLQGTGVTINDARNGLNFKRVNALAALNATASGTELLQNGGFELDDDLNNVPDLWTQKTPTSDRRRCNTETKTFAFQGLCAYQFKSSAGENSKLRQEPSANGIAVGDGLVASGYISAKGVVNASVKVRIAYTNPALPKGKITIKFTKATSGYVAFDGDTVVTGVPSLVRFQLQNRGTAGKVFFDAVSLQLFAFDSRAADLNTIPLPASN